MFCTGKTAEAGMKSKLLCFSSGAEGKRRCRLRQALGGRGILRRRGTIRDYKVLFIFNGRSL